MRGVVPARILSAAAVYVLLAGGGLASETAPSRAQAPPTPTVAVRTAVPFDSLPAGLVHAMGAYAQASVPTGEPYVGDCNVRSTGGRSTGIEWCSAVLDLTESAANAAFAHAFSSGGPSFQAAFSRQADGTWQAVPGVPAAGTGVGRQAGGAATVFLLAGFVSVALACAGGWIVVWRAPRSRP
jgi:hypothetical protein